MAFLNPEEPVTGKYNGIRNPNIGPDRMSPEAQAWQNERLRPGGTPKMPPTGAPGGGLPQRAGAALRNLPGVQTAVGLGGAMAKGARIAAPAAAMAGVVENFNDYKIDDPEVDSTAKGTFNALRSGDFGMAKRSLSKGALETAMDLGSGVANALDYVVPGKAPVSTAYNQKLREQFGSLLVDNTPKPDAGAGRGYVNPPGVDPTRQVAPASTPTLAAPDYSNEGRSTPTPITRAAPNPAGQIFRDGNTYSGKDIKFGADIVAPGMDALDAASGVKSGARAGFGVTSLDTGEGFRQNLLELNRLRSERAEREAGFAANQPGGGLSGINSSYLADAEARSREMDFKQALDKMSPRQRAAAVMQQQALRNQADLASAQNSATLRGQELSAGTARRGQDLAAETARGNTRATLRGQDLDYAGRIDAKKMDLSMRMAERKLRGEIMQQAGGDMFKAAQLAAANGLSPTDFLAVGSGVQTQGEKADAAGRGMFKDLFNTPNKDGKMESRPDLEALAYESAMKQSGNKLGSLPKEQQTALMTEAVARVRELESARSRQNGTFGQEWLGRPNEPLLDSLPTTEQNAGSRLRHATPWDAFNSNIQMNDVLQVLPDGRVIARDPKLMTQGRLKQLEEQGARWEK